MDRWTVVGIADAVRAGARKAAEVVEDALERIEAANGDLGAFVHLDPVGARAAAAAVDDAVARGEDPGPFAGVPLGVKDLDDCRGMPTSHGSLVYAGGEPAQRDAFHVARLRAAGAVFVGKTNAPEFGTLNFTKTKAFAPARNPWDPSRTPGGSSGGSAAAVASGMVPAATASDGGGSTRIPAAFSGLVGMKASYGRIPVEGHAGSETAVKGLLTTTVRDAARHLDVTAGPHGSDRMSLPRPPLVYEDIIETLDVHGLRARWSADLGFAAVDPEVAAVAEQAARGLCEAAGLELDGEDVSFTDPVRAWQRIGAMDLWFDIDRATQWPGVADDVTRYVRSVLEQTEHHPLSRFADAVKLRERLDAEVGELFDQVDVLLTPTVAVPAFPAEGPPTVQVGDQEVTGAMTTPFTMLANLSWNPACSVPAGMTAEGLPVGLQIMVARHRDERALRLARIWERTAPWPRVAPGR